MSLKTISEAASQLGTKCEVLEDWIRRGLLSVHCLEPDASRQAEQRVDEDEVRNVAESLGWLQVSADGWDGNEGK